MPDPDQRPSEPGGFIANLGIEVGEVGEGRAVATVVATDRHLNPGGTIHGGVIASLVDTAMGRAVRSVLAEDEIPVTIEMKVNFLEAGDPGLIRATASLIRRGRVFIVVHAEVVQDSDDDALAEAMATFTSTSPG